MSVLLNLPTDIGQSVLEWLDLETFSALDMAMCNSVIRCQYLSLLSPSSCIENIDLTTVSLYNWICSRQIRVSGMMVNGHVLSQCNMLLISTNRLRTIWVTSTQLNDELNNFLASCKHLDTILLHNVSNIQALIPCVLQSLKSLEIDDDVEVHSCMTKIIASSCRNLEILNVHWFSFDSDTYYADVLRLNPNLKEIDLNCHLNLLASVQKHCNHIQRITLEVQSIDLLDILKYLRHNPSIQSLEVNSGGWTVLYQNQIVNGSQYRLFKLDYPDLFEDTIPLELVVSEVNEFIFENEEDEFPSALFQWLSLWKDTLHKVSLSPILCTDLRTVLEKCPHIVSLHVLMSEPEILDTLSACGLHLKNLEVTFVGVYVTFEEVNTLLSNCARLEYVNLTMACSRQSIVDWCAHQSFIVQRVKRVLLHFQCVDFDYATFRLEFIDGVQYKL